MHDLQDELTFEAEPLRWTPGATDERTRTLERVAAWLVGDLFARGNVASADELTDAAFAVLHPELGGRRIATGESTLVSDWRRIKRDIVEPRMRATATATLPPVTTPLPASSAGLPALSGKKIPEHYTEKKRNGVSKGLAKYGGGDIVTVLRPLMAKGVVRLSEADLDTFKRISNVESMGKIQALNTWDSAVVSIGFLQLTLQWGELQEWIRRAPIAFARYGIAVEPSRKYTFPSKKTPNLQPAIVGAQNKDDLRWNGWAQRFYLAGLDPEIIAAEVELGKELLAKGLASAKRYLAQQSGAMARFQAAYDRSLPLRGLYQEALNNKPVGARDGLRRTMARAIREGVTTADGVYEIAKQEFVAAFKALNDEGSGKSVVDKTANGL